MKSSVEWLAAFMELPDKLKDTAKNDVDRLVAVQKIIEQIQADALDERRSRIEAAAVTGLMASSRAPNGAIIDSPPRVAQIARTMAAHMDPREEPKATGPEDGRLEVVVQARINGHLHCTSANRTLTSRELGAIGPVLSGALGAALADIAAKRDRNGEVAP